MNRPCGQAVLSRVPASPALIGSSERPHANATPDRDAAPLRRGQLPFLNRLNAEWTAAARRLSPPVLIHLLEWARRECVAFFRTLDPDGPAAFPVAWAGEEESKNFFDLAREYTERWH